MEIKEQDLFAEVSEEATVLPETSHLEDQEIYAPEEPEDKPMVTPELEVSVDTIETKASHEAIAPETPKAEQSVKEAKPTTETKPLSKHEPNIIWQLFSTFFKIGVVTFGGGYAMIPMIESEVVDKKKWVEKDTFLDLIAIAQTCPGVFAINISTFIGYKLRRNLGACMAALGAALPSFIIILLIATMFTQIQDVPWVAACFRGIRPAVVALIAVPTFNLAKSAKINLSNCWIPIISALLIYLLGVNPVFIIIAAALGGYLYGTFLANPQQ